MQRQPSLRAPIRPHLPGRTVRSRLTWLYGGLFLASGAVLLVITGILWGNATARPFPVPPWVPTRILGIQAGTGPVRVVGIPTPQQHELVSRQLQSVAAQQHSADLRQLLLYSGVALAIMAILSIALSWLTAGRVLRPLRTITATARRISATNLDERLSLDGPDDELKVLGDTFDQLLERLERSFQSQRQFVANASHELRTPLATMRAELDVAVAKPDPVPEQTVRLAGQLREELDRVDALLGSFLLLARAQAGPMTEDGCYSLDLLVASSFEDRSQSLADMDIRVFESDCPDAVVAGNEALLSRMVGNLIDNAVLHNQRGGWIRARTELDGATARLTVENSGPVLDDAQMTELARPFRRLGPERTGTDGGFGLGLSIVSSIVAAHQGNLRLHPLPGGGLRAIVDLPVGAERPVGVPG